MQHRYTVALIVTVLACATPAFGLLTPAQKCEAGKNLAAGKYAACRLKAESKLVKTGDTAKYTETIDKCYFKFNKKWVALEGAANGACPTGPDEPALESLIRNHANLVAFELSGDSRFVTNTDGTVTDQQSKLTWEKKVKLDSITDYSNLHDADNSYLWANTCSVNTGKRCQPSAAAAAACAAGVDGDATGCDECTGGDGTCTFYSASTIWEWLVSLNTAAFAGHNDWRLPKLSELETIVDRNDTTEPAVDAAFDGASCGGSCTDITSAACSCTRPGEHWSSTTIGAEGAWFVDFSYGRVDGFFKDGTWSVRAVRGG
jgi:hypothetical protein